MPASPNASPSAARRLAGLERVALSVRAFLEPLWLSYTLADEWSSVEPPLSRGTCRVSAEFLAAVMPELGFGGWSVYVGPEGFVTDEGRPWPHYWLSDGVDVVDLTADQFGLPPVVVGRPDRTRYVAGPAQPLAGDRGEHAHVGRWIATWRERGGRPFDGGMTAALMDEFAGRDADALAALLHLRAGAGIATAGRRSGPGRTVAVWGDAILDAGGTWDRASYAEYSGIPADDVRQLDAPAAQSFVAGIDRSAMEAASVFATRHPALANVIRQAAYDRGAIEDPAASAPFGP